LELFNIREKYFLEQKLLYFENNNNIIIDDDSDNINVNLDENIENKQRRSIRVDYSMIYKCVNSKNSNNYNNNNKNNSEIVENNNVCCNLS
jgi:hypothetical protein